MCFRPEHVTNSEPREALFIRGHKQNLLPLLVSQLRVFTIPEHSLSRPHIPENRRYTMTESRSYFRLPTEYENPTLLSKTTL